MFERLQDKNATPAMEVFTSHMGKGKELFKNIDSFLTNEINAENAMKVDAHSQCWKLSYHIKRKYVCDIIAEKDAFTVVTRLSGVESAYNNVSPYGKACMDNSPYRHKGWIAYRVLAVEHLEDVKALLQARNTMPP